MRSRADEILRIQAAIARLKEQHAGVDGDPVAYLFLEHAEEQLTAALADGNLARDAVAAAQSALARAGQGATMRAVLREAARTAATRHLPHRLASIGVGRPASGAICSWEVAFEAPVRGSLVVNVPKALAEESRQRIVRLAEEAAAHVASQLAGPEREIALGSAREVDGTTGEGLPLVAALVLVFEVGWVELALEIAGA